MKTDRSNGIQSNRSESVQWGHYVLGTDEMPPPADRMLPEGEGREKGGR